MSTSRFQYPTPQVGFNGSFYPALLACTNSCCRALTATLSRSTFTGLRCKECGHPYEASARHVCEDVCFGPLEVVYDYDAIRNRVSRASIEAGPTSIWRYREFLPIEGDPIDVGTGFTLCSRPTGWPAASASGTSISRMTASICQRSPSRIGWFLWHSPGPANSASPQ